MKLTDKTQCQFTPDAGTVKPPVFCGVCNAEMVCLVNNSKGPRGWAQSVGMNLRNEKEVQGNGHDVYECPNIDNAWHMQVIELREEAEKTSSLRIKNILEMEAEEVLFNKKPTNPKYNKYTSYRQRQMAKLCGQ